MKREGRGEEGRREEGREGKRRVGRKEGGPLCSAPLGSLVTKGPAGWEGQLALLPPTLPRSPSAWPGGNAVANHSLSV